MRRSRIAAARVAAIGCLFALVGLTIAMTILTQKLSANGGLAGAYRAGTAADGPSWMQAIDREVWTDLVGQRSRERGGAPFGVEWTGYLLAPQTREYRFAVRAKSAAALSLDGIPVASSDMARGGAPLKLTRGLHRLQLEFSSSTNRPSLDVLWATTSGPFTRISPLLFVPDVDSYADGRLRRFAVAMNRAVPWLWFVASWALVAVALAKMSVGAWLWPGLTRAQIASLVLILAFSCVLFGTGLTWGSPDHLWGADEVRPSDILDGMQARFAGGWATIYPPLHFAILAVFYAPFLMAGHLHLISFRNPETGSDLFTAARLVSCVMAVGIIALVYAAAREHKGARAGALAAIIACAILPLTYYAKTNNLDVPYVFWLSLALVAYLKILRSDRPRNYYLFALAGVASICTKDQAYGFFVLPACVLTVRLVRQNPGLLWRLALVCLLAFVAGQNLPWNWRGFAEHVRLILGPASEGYRMYPRTLAGYGAMSREAFIQLGHVMGWPLFLSSIAVVTISLARNDKDVRWLLLPPISYGLFFIGIAMYHYDRFFLGVAVMLAIVTGGWFAEWTRPGTRGRWMRVAVVLIVLGHALARAAALDMLMIGDSRYAAERQLAPLGQRTDVIAALGGYVPRESVLGWTPLAADPAVVETKQPRFLVLNVAFSLRDDAGSPRRLFYEALSQGKTRYKLAFRTRTPPRFPLSLEGEFQRVTDDPFSNLTKINPLIEVYVRDDDPR